MSLVRIPIIGVARAASLPEAAQDQLLHAVSDLLVAARALKASKAEFEKRSNEVEELMVEHGLADPRRREPRRRYQDAAR